MRQGSNKAVSFVSGSSMQLLSGRLCGPVHLPLPHARCLASCFVGISRVLTHLDQVFCL